MLLLRGFTGVLRCVKIKSLRRHQKFRLFSQYVRAGSSATHEYNIDLKVNNVNLNNYILKLQHEYEVLTRETDLSSNSRYIHLKSIITLLDERKNVTNNIDSLKELIDSEDKDLSDLAKEENLHLNTKLKDLDDIILEALIPVEKADLCESIVLEIQAGVGGQEAMLFAQEMFEMYCSFITKKGWDYEIAGYLTTDLGGLRHASILVSGPQVFKYFKYEGGVHRVQRIPATEKAGRIHTSTVSVVALPQPSDIDVNVQQKDLKIETKRSTGAGGQHVNTTDSAIRIVHLPTNIAVECQVDRSQIKNRKMAMARLRALLYQKELDAQMASMEATRKNQVKSNNRNEKIRTYNYSQDRITDHRLHSVHFHNLKGFMEGGEDLEEMIDQLDRQAKLDNLLEIVENTCK